MPVSMLRQAIHLLLIFVGLTGFAGLLIATPVYAASTIYVRPNGTHNGDGKTWDTATTLQTALAIANAGDQIWVQEGAYLPTATLDRSATFQLKQGVALYGGFAGTETSLIQRNPLLYPSVLSGNIGSPTDPTDNSYHVVTATNVDTSTRIDGFIIADGYALGTGSNDYGGGMFIQQATPLVHQILFRHNSASLGGGLAAYQASPTIRQCSFMANHADSGGGIAVLTSDLTISHALMVSNTVTQNGGGIALFGSGTPIVNYSRFYSNTAQGGGAIAVEYGARPRITQTLLDGNMATTGGGVLVFDLPPDQISQPSFNQLTIVNNIASNGGAVAALSGNTTIVNSILWSNGPVPFLDNSERLAIQYSLVEGGVNGEGNLASDPYFVNLIGEDQVGGTLDDNLRLRMISPAVNAGNDALISTDQTDENHNANTNEAIPFDLDGRPRHIGTHTDLGAYEWQIQLFLPILK